jgi:hypothetical protein
MIFTNKRLIFVGNENVVSIPLPEILAAEFIGNQAKFKYAGMMNGESYTFSGNDDMNTELYYKGITKKGLTTGQ